jgi:hypothetical protein
MAIRENLPQDERLSQSTGPVLIICGDLFFGTQLMSLVRQAGHEPVQEMSAARGLARIGGLELAGIVVDLETPHLDLPAILAALPAESRPKVIAFGPHVHEGKLEAAREAGCDAVVTRGQISSGPAVLRTLLTRTD